MPVGRAAPFKIVIDEHAHEEQKYAHTWDRNPGLFSRHWARTYGACGNGARPTRSFFTGSICDVYEIVDGCAASTSTKQPGTILRTCFLKRPNGRGRTRLDLSVTLSVHNA